ncbi:putative signal transducing protein [Terriglobus tenax]|uniref:putative signal transducing protein n=1 Tax=Terriglobus tenax TaxID=1111115 RepID=UPI0021E0CB4D|nr:DUF2007 domain-containing protein [Terriglobus tenax]
MSTTSTNPDDLVTVARFSNPAEADLAQGILESAGIEFFLSGEEASHLIPASFGSRLQVRRADEEAAKELLNNPPAPAEGATLADDGNDL